MSGKKKNIYIVVLSILLVSMGTGFAILTRQLKINSSANIDSKWDVGITDLTQSDKTGGAYEITEPNFTRTTATFNVGLISPGDSITYVIYISNLGNLSAKLSDISISEKGSSAIKYELSGIKKGDILSTGAREPKRVKIKISYDPSVTDQPTETSKNYAVTFTFVQNTDKEEGDDKIAELQNYVPTPYIIFYGADKEKLNYEITDAADWFSNNYFDGTSLDYYTSTSRDGSYTFLKTVNTAYNGEYTQSNYNDDLYYKIKRYIIVNGKKYYSKESEPIYINFKNSNCFVSNENKILKYIYDSSCSGDVVIPNNIGGTKINYVDSNIFTVGENNIAEKNRTIKTITVSNGLQLVPGSLKLSDNSSLTKIINKTGAEQNWGKILGLDPSTCVFETGSCGNILITK